MEGLCACGGGVGYGKFSDAIDAGRFAFLDLKTYAENHSTVTRIFPHSIGYRWTLSHSG